MYRSKYLLVVAAISIMLVAVNINLEDDSKRYIIIEPTEITVETVTATSVRKAKPTVTKKPTPNPTNTITPTPTPKLKLIGVFRATGYCPCRKCCGRWGGKRTASGTRPTANRTISTDPRVIKTGSHVFINGKEYIAEDTGSAIKGIRIDIFFKTHKEASAYGVKKIKVYRKAK